MARPLPRIQTDTTGLRPDGQLMALRCVGILILTLAAGCAAAPPEDPPEAPPQLKAPAKVSINPTEKPAPVFQTVPGLHLGR